MIIGQCSQVMARQCFRVHPNVNADRSVIDHPRKRARHLPSISLTNNRKKSLFSTKIYIRPHRMTAKRPLKLKDLQRINGSHVGNNLHGLVAGI
ncbi:hypothetical protein TNCT_27111 [Trichonephila clavata]|uniref:Uncharacterized protein n=1 Tax=Trichonephila clavata TaxID=2740835 RepID=A0A8X6IVD5_TRICU|nr:hypothetical protein TNCT_27111 [Trichonephila clavata]